MSAVINFQLNALIELVKSDTKSASIFHFMYTLVKCIAKIPNERTKLIRNQIDWNMMSNAAKHALKSMPCIWIHPYKWSNCIFVVVKSMPAMTLICLSKSYFSFYLSISIQMPDGNLATKSVEGFLRLKSKRYKHYISKSTEKPNGNEFSIFVTFPAFLFVRVCVCMDIFFIFVIFRVCSGRSTKKDKIWWVGQCIE